ncbi:MAG: hypothetical protein PHT60_03540 [Acidiphilium sp.]|nr:hypothetical protein [Acidiphilium sp.]MDD4934830.1 hypothetical protein [Acidiphilium sp.]
MDTIKSRILRQSAYFFIIICFFSLILVRIPSIVLDGGRFWAEEGVVYFSNAWNYPWYISWFAVASDAGYVNLAAGLSTWLGLNLGGISDAPAITVAIALIIQSIPVYIVITHDFPWRHSLGATIVAVILCAIPPVTGEVWLNTITSQFHLALCAALIFSGPPRHRLLFFSDCAILVLAVLSGPATSFLMPLFIFVAVKNRTFESSVQATIILIGFFIQIIVFLLHPLPERGSHFGPTELLSVISLHTIVLQSFGLNLAREFARYLGASHRAHMFLWAGPSIFIFFYAIIAAGIWRKQNMVLAKLYVACLVIVLVSFYEAWAGSFDGFMHVVGGQRYAFAPEVINALLIVGLATINRGITRGLFVLAATALLFTGFVNYRRGIAQFSNGPLWQPQVAAWQKNPSRTLTVWPGGPWALSLAPRHSLSTDKK